MPFAIAWKFISQTPTFLEKGVQGPPPLSPRFHEVRLESWGYCEDLVRMSVIHLEQSGLIIFSLRLVNIWRKVKSRWI